MRAHWTALGVGLLIGAALGWWMGSKPIGAISPIGNTTRFNLAN